MIKILFLLIILFNCIESSSSRLTRFSPSFQTIWNSLRGHILIKCVQSALDYKEFLDGFEFSPEDKNHILNMVSGSLHIIRRGYFIIDKYYIVKLRTESTELIGILVISDFYNEDTIKDLVSKSGYTTSTSYPLQLCMDTTESIFAIIGSYDREQTRETIYTSLGDESKVEHALVMATIFVKMLDTILVN